MPRTAGVALLSALLFVLPLHAAADEPGDALSRVEAIASDAGVEVADLLSIELPLRDGGGRAVPMTVEELVAVLDGRELVDPSYSGIAGTPEIAAGNLVHAFVALKIYRAPRSHVPDLDDYRYSVREASASPDTPFVPVVNPLLAAGNPGGLPPVLGFHAGGRLKSVQASGYATGFHSAGTTPVGSSVDTAPREPGTGDTVPAPVYTPLVHPGTLTLPDSAIDFVGYAQVATGGSCSKLNIPFTGDALFTCAGGGLLAGDGAANFNGGPVDLRDDVPVLWEPVPALPTG